MRSDRYVRHSMSEDPFLFCHWFQAAVSIALIAALFMVRSFHPDWVEVLLELLSQTSFRVSDIFHIIQKFS